MLSIVRYRNIFHDNLYYLIGFLFLFFEFHPNRFFSIQVVHYLTSLLSGAQKQKIKYREREKKAKKRTQIIKNE